MATVTEFSGPHPIPSLRMLGNTTEAANTVISAPHKLKTHRGLYLALTYGSPAVIGPGLWACLRTVTVGGDTKKARRQCQDTPHPPNAMFPGILSLRRGPASDITQSQLLFAWCCRCPSVPGVGRSLPVCTDIPLSDFRFLLPFPEINLRSCSIHLLSTHPPQLSRPSSSFLPHPHTHLLISSSFSLSHRPDWTLPASSTPLRP